jgi:hypothetical protein
MSLGPPARRAYASESVPDALSEYRCGSLKRVPHAMAIMA